MKTSSWRIQEQSDDLSGLAFSNTNLLQTQLDDDEVLVEMRAASLNYRDLVLAKVPHSVSVSDCVEIY